MDLSVILDVHLAIGIAHAAGAAFVGLRLIGVDVAVFGEFLNQTIHQVVHLFGRHVLQSLLNALGLFRIEHLALLERALKRVLQVLKRVLIPLAKAHVLILKSAFEEEIGQGLEKIFGAESEVIVSETRVVNPLHLVKLLSRRTTALATLGWFALRAHRP